MRKYLFILLGFVLMLSLVPINYAQSRTDLDGDGIVNTSDNCPNRPGPRTNGGCPLDEPTTVPDRDGDGNPDTADRCPDQGGPASNGGCPEGQTEPCPAGFTGANCDLPETAETEVPQEPLPSLPEDGHCMLATIGRSRVNVREIPDMAGEVIGQLDPYSVYPVHFHIVGINPEDEWYLVDLGWVSATVVRLAGNCRHIPTVRLPEPLVVHIGDLALVFVGDENFDPATADFPTDQLPTDQFPTDQIPPFLVQSCGNNLKVSWLMQDFHFCDGSVMPTDQMPNDTDGSAFECDGSVKFFEELLGENDTALDSILIGLLLPAIRMGDGSVVPINEFLGDGSVMPCDDATNSNVVDHRYQLLLGMVGDDTGEAAHGTGGGGGAGDAAHGTGGGGGSGKAHFQDIHFLAVMDSAGHFGIIMMLLPAVQDDDGSVGDPFAAFSLNFTADPPGGIDWTQIGNLKIGQLNGDIYLCPGELAEGDGSVRPSTGFNEVGFNPQPDPPGSCLTLNFTNEQ